MMTSAMRYDGHSRWPRRLGRPPASREVAEAALAFADSRVPVVPTARLRAGTEPTAHDFVRAVDDGSFARDRNSVRGIAFDVAAALGSAVEPLAAEDGGGFAALVPDLPGCMSDGESPEEAISNVRDAIRTWLDTARETGRTIPAPSRHLALA